jgi:hypothetical protein
MSTRVCLSLALLVAMPAWSQVPIDSLGAGTGSPDQMQTPPPVSADSYPTAVGGSRRSNYLRAGLVFSTAYTDNVLGTGGNPVSDVVYTISPTIALDKTAERLHWVLTYSPGFTFYQHTSSRNQSDQNVAVDFQYRLSPHITVSLRDTLIKTSNPFSQSESLTGSPISGSGQPPLVNVIGPVANQLGNIATAEVTYQFSRNGMIGGQGTFTNLTFLNQSEVTGLYDSTSTTGSAFYSYRLSRGQYMGVTYRYSRILAYPINAQTDLQSNTIFGFYTIYLNPNFSLSVTGGPQHFEISQAPLPSYGSWSPSITGSMGWRGQHATFALSYTRVVTGGGGLVGAFQANIASTSVHLQTGRTWSLGASSSYSSNKTVSPSSFLSTEGGHSIFGTVSVQHQLSERLQLEFGYTRAHQSYSGIPVISNAPNTDRGFVSISYSLSRPLGG